MRRFALTLMWMEVHKSAIAKNLKKGRNLSKDLHEKQKEEKN